MGLSEKQISGLFAPSPFEYRTTSTVTLADGTETTIVTEGATEAEALEKARKEIAKLLGITQYTQGAVLIKEVYTAKDSDEAAYV